jgi:hypothetical protein
VSRRFQVCLIAVAHVVCATVASGAPDAPTRLDRFRQLALSRLDPAQALDADPSDDAYREIYALLDEEVVESLASGGVFASPEFLQERLDGFAEVWGGASLKLRRVGALSIGAFHLAEGPGGASVRVYGGHGHAAALLRTFHREGRPRLHALPPASGGRAQLWVAWEGALTGRGTRAVRVDLLRQTADSVARVWSTEDLFPEGLVGRSLAIRGEDVRVRYELHYQGWTPGCDGQTEAEDVYRLQPATGTVGRVSHHQINAWHQSLRASVGRLFAALTGGDRASLVTLVPDRALRERLPAPLTPEPACDAAEGSNPAAVSVAATAGGRQPWTLIFRRAGASWRLVAAQPVIE